VWNLTPRLSGKIVILEPLGRAHATALLEASRAQAIWDWWSVDMSTPDAFRAWFDDALAASEQGTRAHFATLDARTGVPVGSSMPALRSAGPGWPRLRGGPAPTWRPSC